MPSYSSPLYNVRYFVPQGFAASFGTSTATTFSVPNVVTSIARFRRRSAVSAVRLRCTAAPNAGVTNYRAHVLNGTDTFGTAVLTTATVGQFIDFTITDPGSSNLSSNTQPTISITGTATATALSLGAFDVWFEVKELPDQE